jgi:stage II sporulation protein P
MFRQQKWLGGFRSILGWFFMFFFLRYCFYGYSSWPWHGQEIYLGKGASRELLCAAMPVIAWVDKEEDFLPGPLASFLLKIMTPLKLDISHPVSVLKLEIPFLAQIDASGEQAISVVATPVTSLEKLPEKSHSELTEGTLVGIYHTHTGETYTLTDGVDRLEGKQGGVVQVGVTMKEVLEKQGIKVVHSDKIHDVQYAISYRESEKTLRELLAEHQKVAVVLDVHRDAGRPRKDSLVKINGQEVAPVLLIVGSSERLPFPSWRENLKFANALADRLNEKYPGFCLGVRVQDGRYNQYLHPRAVLVEMGSASNSTEEAVASARLFAGVLGEMIVEIIKKGK